jgi:hypothetical protein
MKRAIAKQAEAERERRAKVINAEGECQAAQKLIEAAALMETQPMSLQLRYLQTLNTIAAEQLHDRLPHTHRSIQSVPEADRKKLNAHEAVKALGFPVTLRLSEIGHEAILLSSV